MRIRGGSRGLRAGALGALAALVLAPAAPTPAGATSAPPSPWDGVNPFACAVQDARLGATVPHPDADPFCIHFDKRNQNLTEGGMATFLLAEPARTAMAAPKCFYFQEDHWRSSVVQSDGRTVIYEWIGHYFFDKATGDGGVWVTGFSLNRRTFDPTSLPGFPPAYGSYFGPGTGGVITHDAFAADPACAARAKAHPGLYARSARTSPCLARGGIVRRRAIGPVTLGEPEDRIRAALGAPRGVQRGFLRYCVAGGGTLLAGEAADRTGSLGAGGRAPAVVLLTTSRRFVLRGRKGRAVGVGSSRRALAAALPAARRLGGSPDLRAGGTVFVLRGGRVRAIGVYDRGRIRSTRTLLAFLRRAGV